MFPIQPHLREPCPSKGELIVAGEHRPVKRTRVVPLGIREWTALAATPRAFARQRLRPPNHDPTGPHPQGLPAPQDRRRRPCFPGRPSNMTRDHDIKHHLGPGKCRSFEKQGPSRTSLRTGVVESSVARMNRDARRRQAVVCRPAGRDHAAVASGERSVEVRARCFASSLVFDPRDVSLPGLPRSSD